MSAHRPARAALLLLTAAAVLAAVPALTGCADAGELESAGPTPTAVGPTRLWPDRPAATIPPVDYGEGETETVRGIRVPGDDVRRVRPVAVAQAEQAAHPDALSGPDGMYEETAGQLEACDTRPKTCPVLKAYYRDLTGDGKAELILGVSLPKGQLVVRCYLAEKGRLTRIMGTSDAVIGVSLAGRDLIIRAPSNLPGYEFRTAWSWDGHQHAMLPTRDEILRVHKEGGEPLPSHTHSHTAPDPNPAPATSAPTPTGPGGTP
ncbi:hypothetical protein AS594_11555 [Streptomyces agglomeratus]|uniref:Lipoprotein n=1 Tax=Streptomyces agglomeratus TaxID=285458 RepID=A0A1E5P651_9ACTN|nr:hypothetical protein [Streptomyces agglomeratus]OEJ25026.1 hypothetical protein AS594_11555 [Streptomyces agglomeratus]OEJ53484.1 hypothetical protein BGK72_24550 [Streptomyces agglomeratus]